MQVSFEFTHVFFVHFRREYSFIDVGSKLVHLEMKDSNCLLLKKCWFLFFSKKDSKRQQYKSRLSTCQILNKWRKKTVRTVWVHILPYVGVISSFFFSCCSQQQMFKFSTFLIKLNLCSIAMAVAHSYYYYYRCKLYVNNNESM